MMRSTLNAAFLSVGLTVAAPALAETPPWSAARR